jgi:tRNA(Arg) A34 adenosine deaminase TadA
MMKRACELATISVSKGCGPFGCVITDQDGFILSESHNQVIQTNDPTAHAEMVAIRQACKCLNDYKLTNCKLYSSCEPCPMCLSAIYWARLTHIYYGNTRKDAEKIGFDDDYIYEELKKNIGDRNIKIERIESSNTSEGFDLWVNKKDKLFY